MRSFLQCTRYHGHRHRVRSFGCTHSPFNVLVVLDFKDNVHVLFNVLVLLDYVLYRRQRTRSYFQRARCTRSHLERARSFYLFNVLVALDFNDNVLVFFNVLVVLDFECCPQMSALIRVLNGWCVGSFPETVSDLRSSFQGLG